jgi:hypothetical protein
VAPLHPAEIVSALERLHAGKDRAYRDAWRKRGELAGIFCNIARKYDRLEVAIDDIQSPVVESWIETSADLCLYAVKYVTWLIEQHPELTAEFIGNSELWSAERGHEAVVQALSVLSADPGSAPPGSLNDALAEVRRPFSRLESILLSEGPADEQDRLNPAWALARASLRSVWAAASNHAVLWDQFVRGVDSND